MQLKNTLTSIVHDLTKAGVYYSSALKLNAVRHALDSQDKYDAYVAGRPDQEGVQIPNHDDTPISTAVAITKAMGVYARLQLQIACTKSAIKLEELKQSKSVNKRATDE